MISLSTGPSDLGDWAAPVIQDVLTRAYEPLAETRAALTRALVLAHGRLWRFLVDGDVAAARRARTELLEFGRAHRVERTRIGEADRAVIVEVLECIMTRHRMSPATACKYTLVMMEAASLLGDEPEARAA
ncbi:MAG TPA: hypothetical protein VIL72_05255 [Beijerinckiaceae bacterium]